MRQHLAKGVDAGHEELELIGPTQRLLQALPRLE
jgi:hypothetical protein